jgi:hypothetical protein
VCGGRELKVARQTVRKCLLDADPPRYHQTDARCAPVVGPVKDVIDDRLAQDVHRPPKQRHTARRIYMRLVEEYGFTGGESTIRRYVRMVRGDQREVFIYRRSLSWAPAACATRVRRRCS